MSLHQRDGGNDLVESLSLPFHRLLLRLLLGPHSQRIRRQVERHDNLQQRLHLQRVHHLGGPVGVAPLLPTRAHLDRFLEDVPRLAKVLQDHHLLRRRHVRIGRTVHVLRGLRRNLAVPNVPVVVLGLLGGRVSRLALLNQPEVALRHRRRRRHRLAHARHRELVRCSTPLALRAPTPLLQVMIRDLDIVAARGQRLRQLGGSQRRVKVAVHQPAKLLELARIGSGVCSARHVQLRGSTAHFRGVSLLSSAASTLLLVQRSISRVN